MSRFRHINAGTFARTIFALAGALLLVVIAGENSARAGCGDYVFIRDANGRLVRASTLMARHGGPHVCTGLGCPDDQAELEAEPQQPGPPAKPPCNGSNCSGQSQPLVPPSPPAPQRTSQESTVLLLKSAAEGCPAGKFEYAPADRERELHFPQSIFHPPR